jgi:hypothetical protein
MSSALYCFSANIERVKNTGSLVLGLTEQTR